MAKLFNLARMTVASAPGTGTITLGSAVSGFLSFAGAGVANGDVVAYGISDGSASEVGTGTYTSAGTTLTRTVLTSTNGGSAINASASAQVFITALKEQIANLGEANTFTNTGQKISPATGGAFHYLNPVQASQQAMQYFQQSGADKWTQGKQSDDSFVLFDAIAGSAVFQVMSNGANFLIARNILPAANDTVTIGSATVGIADIHIAAGGVLNWANGALRIWETSGRINVDTHAVAIGTDAIAAGLTNCGIIYADTVTPTAAEAAALQLSPGFAAVNSTSVYGIALAPAGVAGTATFTNFYGFRSEAYVKGTNNTVTNCYGLYLDTQTAGSTINRSLYSAGVAEFAANAIFRTTLTNAGGFEITPRERLSATKNYYVRTDGSDSNTGLVNNSGGAFLTIQKAIDVICSSLDLGINDVNVNIADGTYTGRILLKRYASAGGQVYLIGNNTTPANVLISTTSQDCVNNNLDSSRYTLRGMKFQTTTSGFEVFITGGTRVTLDNCNFGATAAGYTQIVCSNGDVLLSTSYTISGAAAGHAQAMDRGSISATFAITVTISGTPAFTTFVTATSQAALSFQGITWSGTATGKRFAADMNSLITTNGAALTYFPGSTAGTIASGGIYT